MREAFRDVGERTGIDFEVEEPNLRIIEEDYGRERLRFGLYFVGAHPRSHPRAIQLDITRRETVAFEPVTRRVHHEYSDRDDASDCKWRCNALEEVLAEKLRAVLGQRRYAISGDFYDIHTLSQRDLDVNAVQEALPEKIAAREIDGNDVSAARMLSRRDEFEDDWERNLVPLVPEAEALDFDEIWEATAAYVQRFTPVRPARPAPSDESWSSRPWREGRGLRAFGTTARLSPAWGGREITSSRPTTQPLLQKQADTT